MASDLQIDAHFVDVGEAARVLCRAHWTELYPKASGVPVSDLEQRQSVLFHGSPIRCEECMNGRYAERQQIPVTPGSAVWTCSCGHEQPIDGATLAEVEANTAKIVAAHECRPVPGVG